MYRIHHACTFQFYSPEMQRSNYKPSVKNWIINKEDTEYKVRIFEILKRNLTMPDQKKSGDFYIIDAPTWINVIPITKNGTIILVEQYRHGIHDASLEIPGGVVDDGEEPIQAAKRELLEETGYSSTKWKKMGRVSTNPAIMTNYCETWLAEDCVLTNDINPDDFEDLKVVEMPVNDLMSLIKEGTVHHALIVAAIGLWRLHGKS
jgi:8-oxo-dGTP pyrophosphatase MutT (NUDIX family)